MGWDGMYGMGWDGMGWDGMGWDGMGWDEMGCPCAFVCLATCYVFLLSLLVLAMLSLLACCPLTPRHHLSMAPPLGWLALGDTLKERSAWELATKAAHCTSQREANTR